MGIRCVLCGKKDKSVSYIRFPSNKDIRKQWLKFCKMTEKYLYDSHRLCTDHFKPEDLKKRIKRIVVQPEAVPCIYKKKTDGNICSTGITSNAFSNDNNNVVNYSQSTTVTENITHTSSNQITSSCGTPRESQDFAKEEDISDMDVDPDVDVDPAYCNEIDNCDIPLNNCLTPLKQQKDAYSNKRKCLQFHTELDSNDGIDSTIPMYESPYYFVEVPALTSATCDSSPLNISNPRYVGDIQLSHLASPRRAKRAMNIVRHTVMQQRRKIRTLQKQIRRCKQRISSLKNLVSDLKKRNYISKHAADNLMYIEKVKETNVFAKSVPKKDLKHEDRLRLAEAIINYEFSRDVNHIITPNRFLSIRKEIEEVFPDESGDVWYVPYSKETKRGPLGCLYDKYCSLNRLLVKNGLRRSQRGPKDAVTPQV